MVDPIAFVRVYYYRKFTGCWIPVALPPTVRLGIEILHPPGKRKLRKRPNWNEHRDTVMRMGACLATYADQIAFGCSEPIDPMTKA